MWLDGIWKLLVWMGLFVLIGYALDKTGDPFVLVALLAGIFI